MVVDCFGCLRRFYTRFWLGQTSFPRPFSFPTWDLSLFPATVAAKCSIMPLQRSFPWVFWYLSCCAWKVFRFCRCPCWFPFGFWWVGFHLHLSVHPGKRWQVSSLISDVCIASKLLDNRGKEISASPCTQVVWPSFCSLKTESLTRMSPCTCQEGILLSLCTSINLPRSWKVHIKFKSPDTSNVAKYTSIRPGGLIIFPDKRQYRWNNFSKSVDFSFRYLPEFIKIQNYPLNY